MPSGSPVRLVEEMWWIAAAGRAWGFAFGYRRPRSVAVGATRVRIHDHVALARSVVIVMAVIAAIVRRSAR